MKTYDHAFTFAFSVKGSTHPEAQDVTPAQIRAAIIRRLREIDNQEVLEAVMPPYDTAEE